MKQADSARKLPVLICLLLALAFRLDAQNCYQTFLDEGIAAYNAFQFEAAIKKFEAAKVCADRPNTTDAEEWLAKAQNGYIDRLQIIASRFLTSEGQRAFQQKDYKVAFRLYQEALKYKSDNAQAKDLQQQLLPFLADHQYNFGLDPSLYHPSKIALPHDGSLVVLEKDLESKATAISLRDAGSGAVLKTFKVPGHLSDYHFSKDGKWLAASYFDAKDQREKLNLWNVASGEVRQVFDNIYKSEALPCFCVSAKIAGGWRTAVADVRTCDTRYQDPMTTVTSWPIPCGNRLYALTVFDLDSQKNIYKTTALFTSFLCDQVANIPPLVISGADFRQSLINQKIAQKFSTEGVITTNYDNFVLKENEFRIRAALDFTFSPDGKKFAFHHFGEEDLRQIDFSSEVKITFGPLPKTLIGMLEIIDLENGTTVYSHKSEHEELPQRLLPFGFCKDSKRLVFIDSRRWTPVEFNSVTAKLESKNSVFKTGLNIYDLAGQRFMIEHEQNVFDYFITKNNFVVTWAGDETFAANRRKFSVFDLSRDTLIFSKAINNEFSLFYDVSAEKDTGKFFHLRWKQCENPDQFIEHKNRRNRYAGLRIRRQGTQIRPGFAGW
jgi:tetratricopeptide (TPR) repeat protein